MIVTVLSLWRFKAHRHPKIHGQIRMCIISNASAKRVGSKVRRCSVQCKVQCLEPQEMEEQITVSANTSEKIHFLFYLNVLFGIG